MRLKLLSQGEQERFESLLPLEPGERISYCVPVDLPLDMEDGRPSVTPLYRWVTEKNRLLLMVTNKQLFIVDSREDYNGSKWLVRKERLADYKEIKCESQVNCGILVGTKHSGEKVLIARFSMKEIVRVSYVAQGANLYCRGTEELVTSDEREKYCERCGRALPGTNTCPYCGGGMVTLKKFWNLCGGYQYKLLAISLLMVVSSLISLGMPAIQQSFIDESLMNRSGTIADVLVFVGLMLAATGLLIGINTLKYWLCVSMGALISMDLRRRLYLKIQTLSLSFINERKPGELMNRVASDTTQIRQFMEEVFGSMVSTLVTMIGALLFMLLINWRLTLLTTCLILVVIVVTRIFWHRIHRIFHKQWLKEDKLRSGLQDVISGMRVVKSFGREQAETEKFDQLTREYALIQKKNEGFWAVFYPILTFIMGMGSYLAIYFGGRDVLLGTMSVGTLIQFVTYTGYLYGPLGWMTHLPRSVMQMITSLNRIYDVLDEQPKIVNAKKAVKLEIRGDVDFTDVSFGYHSYDPVLEHIDLHVKQGEMIGFVGASGTGKSTMINLIMRLYDVNRGTLCIDGVNIKDIDQECLHSQIGVVLQETFLFSGSILNNLRYAKPDATMTEIIQAAKSANAHDFICKMPDGYNTYVGEHGYNLSGGERQRIAIARAILNNPRLLILDEATSALDTESEFLIQQALDRLTAGRTTFAIAHRLSTLRNADRLVVIDGHNIAEVGTHNELLEKQGIYYKLVQAQLQMAKVEKPVAFSQ